MNKMGIQVVCVVWGEAYIKIFKNFCLASLEFEKYLNDFHWVIYTRDSDVCNFSDLNIEVRRIDDALFTNISSPIVIQSTVLAQHHRQSTSKFIWYLPPDTVWSKGAIERIKVDLNQDPDVIYMYYCRVNTQDSLRALSAQGCLHSARELYELNRSYIHNIHKSHNINSKYSTKWPEYYWVGDDTIQVAKVVASVPLIINSSKRLDSNNQVIDYQSVKNVIYGGTDTIFCLSLTPKEKDYEWYENFSHLTPSKVANWSLIYGYAKPNNPLEDELIHWVGAGGDEVPLTYASILDKFRFEKDCLVKSRMKDFKAKIRPVYSKGRQLIEHLYLDGTHKARFCLDGRDYEISDIQARNNFFVKVGNGDLFTGIDCVALLRRYISSVGDRVRFLIWKVASLIKFTARLPVKLFISLLEYIFKVEFKKAGKADSLNLDLRAWLQEKIWKMQIKSISRVKCNVRENIS